MNPNQDLSVPQFETTPPQESRHNKKRVARLVSEVALASLVVAGGVGCTTESTTSKMTETASQVPGEVSAIETSRETEVGYGESVLESMRKQSITDLEGMGFKANPEYTENASDTGLADGFFVDLYSAWKVGTENKAEAEKVLASIIDPESDDYTRTAKMIGSGNAPILTATAKVWDSTGNFSKSNYKDIQKSNGYPMRVMTVAVWDDPSIQDAGYFNQYVYQRTNGVLPDGTSTQKWVIKEMMSTDDPRFESNLKELAPTLK